MTSPPIAVSDLDEVLAATECLWQEMRGESLFLTGGSGFFGCWLVESFLHINRALDLNASLTVLSRDPEAFLNRLPHLREARNLSLLEGDVRLFRCYQPHAFAIHAATGSNEEAEQPRQTLSTIVEGTQRVLECAANIGTRKLLLISSGAVYGPQPAEVSHMPETFHGAPDPLLRASLYGEGKRMAEQLCALAANDRLQIKIARCYGFLGPHLPLESHFAAGNFLADALAGRTVRVASDGRAVRSYLYPVDLMIWLWTILFRAPSLRAFNIGSAQPISMGGLAQTIRAEINPGLPLDIQQFAANGAPLRYLPSVDRAAAELNLRQSISLPEAIRRTAAWHRLKLTEATLLEYTSPD